MQSTTPFFVTGGTLRADAPSYVERQADRDLLQGLLRGEYCFVLNTRQMGKSSLMVRTASRLREAGAQVAVLDLTSIGQNLSPEQWYEGLLVSLGQQLRMEDALDDFWLDHERLGPLQRWMEALRQVVLPGLGERGKLVLFIDEIDAVRSLPFSTDEFFGGIRECYNRRAREPVFDQLTVCLLGVATPADLVTETRISPFNIGTRIRLSDFRLEEALPLAEAIPGGRAVLARVLHWTGGQPYMTQLLCRTAAERGIVAPREVDSLCADLFLTQQARESDDHLAFVRNRLLRSEVDLAGLLDLYGQIRRGRRIPDDETDPLCSVLKLSGVCREVDGRLSLRNRVYDRVFDREWVIQHMPGAELRRQREAYRRGLTRAAVIATGVAVLLAGLSAWGFSSAREARRATRLADQRRVEEERQRRKSDRLANSLAESNSRLTAALAEANQQRRRADAAAAAERVQKQSALASRSEAIRQRGRSEKLLIRSYVTRGEQAVDNGDPMGALPWYAKAADLDQTDPNRAKLHRLRLGFTLGKTPKLLGLGRFSHAIRAVWSPTGKHAVIIGLSPMARLWDARGNRFIGPELRLDGDFGNVTFSADGSCVLLGGGGFRLSYTPLRLARSVRIWRCRDGMPITPPLRPGGEVTHAQLSPDGRLAVTAAKGQIQFWDVATARRVGPAAPLPDLRALAFGPDGRLLVVAGQRAAVCSPLLGEPRWKPLRLPEKATSLGELRWAPGGVTAISNIGILFWNTQSEAMEQRSAPLATLGYSLSGDGRHAVGVEYTTGRVQVVNTSNGSVVGPTLAHSGPVEQAELSPDHQRVATASADGWVRVWRLSDGKLDLPPIPHQPAAVSVAWSPDGRQLLTAGFDGLIKAWATSPPPLEVSVEGTDLVAPFATYRSRSSVLISDWRGFVWCSDPNTGRPLGPATRIARPSPQDFYDPAVAVDGLRDRVIPLGTDRPRIWDLKAGKPVTPPLPHRQAPAAAEFSSDGTRVWTVSKTGEILAWDAASGLRLGRLASRPQPRVVELLPGGNQAFVVGYNHSACLWDLRRDVPVSPVFQVGRQTLRARFSPDGQRIACLEGAAMLQPAGMVRCFELSSGRQLGPPVQVGGGVFDVAFTSDGRRLATAAADSTARIWEVESGRSLVPPLRHPFGWAYRVRFSPDDRLLLTASGLVGDRGDVRLWDAQTGDAISPVLNHQTSVRYIGFDPAGRGFLTSSADGTVRSWDLRVDPNLNQLCEGAVRTSGREVDSVGVLGPLGLRPAPALADRLSAHQPRLLRPPPGVHRRLPLRTVAELRQPGSRDTGKETTMTLVNRSQLEIPIFWVDGAGRRSSYGSIRPGQRSRLRTYAGHLWVAAPPGQPERFFVADEDDGIVLF